MALFEKSVTRIAEHDLRSLIFDKEPEGKTLDYKRNLTAGSDTDKKELLYDVSSFANARGGHIIFGMEEAGGVPIELIGLGNIDPDKEISRLEQMTRDGIRPPLSGVETSSIPLSKGSVAIVMRVPKSWNPPHQVIFQKAFRFYGRDSNGKYQMDVDELRSMFAVSGTLGDNIRRFRAERLAQIIGGAAPVALLDGGIIALHIVPFSALSAGAGFPLDRAARQANLFPTLYSDDARRYQITFDGLLTTSNANAPPNPQRAYTLVYRTGAIEAVSSSIGGGQEHNWLMLPKIEEVIVKYATRFMKTLHHCGTEPPIAIMASILGVRGKRFLRDFPPQGAFREDMPSVVLDREQFQFVETIFETIPQDTREAARQLRATLDHVANAAGLPVSPSSMTLASTSR
jgi:hypothetical protein